VLKYLQSKNLAYCKSNDGTTCLHIAVRKGYSHIVDFLLSKRAPDYLK
jgi:ankyrin repeat protein